MVLILFTCFRFVVMLLHYVFILCVEIRLDGYLVCFVWMVAYFGVHYYVVLS